MTTNPYIDIETKFIERFVIKSKRDRYINLIKNLKSRKKFIDSLAHFHDLQFNLFREIKGNEAKTIIDSLPGKIKKCYVVSENSLIDQKQLNIETALEETIGRGMGTFLIFGDSDIVYYESEESGNRWISKT